MKFEIVKIRLTRAGDTISEEVVAVVVDRKNAIRRVRELCLAAGPLTAYNFQKVK